MTRIITFLSLFQAAGLLMSAAGCTSSSAGRSAGLPLSPSLAQPAKPGPVKQLASKVGESSLGKSVSKAFNLTSTKKAKPTLKDPVSLAEKPKPPDADLYVSLGNLRVRESDTAGAREMYHKALSMQPHHLGALLGLARLFDRQGQLDRAAEHYLEATEHHPKEATAFNDLGLCYARQGKYDKAVAALNRAVELQPDRTLYRNNIATVLVAQGRIDEALAHLTDAHGAAVAHYNIGFLLNKRGQQRQALEQFSLAVQVDPKLTAAQEWVDSLSAQMNGAAQSPMYTASNPRPADAASGDRLGPLLAPSGASTDPTAGSRAPEPDVRVVDTGEQPVNQLRSPVRFGAPAEQAPSPQQQPPQQPAAEAETPEASTEGQQEQPPSGATEPTPPAATDPSENTDPSEKQLNYLPPVQPGSARPSRY